MAYKNTFSNATNIHFGKMHKLEDCNKKPNERTT
jgi:hypothetical protein